MADVQPIRTVDAARSLAVRIDGEIRESPQGKHLVVIADPAPHITLGIVLEDQVKRLREVKRLSLQVQRSPAAA